MLRPYWQIDDRGESERRYARAERTKHRRDILRSVLWSLLFFVVVGLLLGMGE
jgi:hypothetical protein